MHLCDFFLLLLCKVLLSEVEVQYYCDLVKKSSDVALKSSLKKKEVVQNGTRRSVEHCTPHADGAWLNELGWSQ